MSNAICADEGDWLACKNGHRMARVTRPLCEKETFATTDFEWTGMPAPEIGGQWPVCPHCGDGLIVQMTDYWRNGKGFGHLVELKDPGIYMQIEGKGWVP